MSTLRIGGIASGFDTDKIVKDLMRVERMKVDRLLQDRQEVEWEKEQFREIINETRSFRDKYFDILRPETNLMSATALKKMEATSSDPETLSVTANANAQPGEVEFEVIESALATRAISSGKVTDDENGEGHLNLSDSMEEVAEKLDKGSFFGVEDEISFTINGESIEIKKSDSLSEAINKINSSDAGVRLSYSSFTDRFTLTATETGEQEILVEDEDGDEFFNALKIDIVDGKVSGDEEYFREGRDAKFKINGIEETYSSNTFNIDGITYSINKRVNEKTGEIIVSNRVDEEGIFETIKGFVEDYNSLIEEVNGRVNEDHHRDFRPLNDEQKDAMSEREIELWEEKAKSGLLRSEPTLQRMLNNLRSAVYDTVGEHHLSQIGINTGNYREQGRLNLDEEKLKETIATDPDKVVELFSRRPDKRYSADLSFEERRERYDDGGIASRLSDVLNDNIRTTRNDSGQKGTLIERAGLEGDTSQINNYYVRQLIEIDQRIDRMNDMLSRREEQYYRQFTAMEKALQELHSQGDWLMQQLNQGQF